MVAGRKPDRVLRVSERESGHLGDALAGRPGAAAHDSPGNRLVPDLVSVDGREIAFVSLRDGEQAIWVVAATGGEPRRVATGGGSGAEWSPDGQWLAYLRQGKMFRIPRNGGAPVPLSTGRHVPTGIRVSHDGRSIYYSVNSGPPEDQDLWRLSLADGAISRLTRLEGRRGSLGYYFAADARYLYVIWLEDDGDIWVMDVVTNAGR